MSCVPFEINRPVQSLSNSWISSFRRGGIDHKLDFRDTIRWEASLPRMFTNHLFAGSNIGAVNLVGRHVAVQPLDCRPRLWRTLHDFCDVAST
jgi:hypothetical protein